MTLPSEIFLDALRFADHDTRLAMLLVNRRFFRIVDESRATLGLPEVWIRPAIVAYLRILMVVGTACMSLSSMGLNVYVTWLMHQKDQKPYLLTFVLLSYGTPATFSLPLVQVPNWLYNQWELCGRLRRSRNLDERAYLARELRRFHVSTLYTFAAIVILTPLQ